MTTSSVPTPTPQTLEQLLCDTESQLFRDYQHYLEQSFCCENLNFWLDVQEYHELYEQQQQQEANQDKKMMMILHVVQQKCHAMIDTYIKPNANQEINIPCELRQELLDQVFVLGNYHPHVFTKITKSVVELMRVNAFIPWISSFMSSPCLSTHFLVNNLPNDQQHHQPLSPLLSSSSSSSISSSSTATVPVTATGTAHPSSSTNNCSSPTSLSFSFVMDRWNSFNKIKSLRRSASMDSTSSLDILEEEEQPNNMVISPPPSPTASSSYAPSPPLPSQSSSLTSSTTRYRSMLKRVKHSFMPQPTTTKSTITTTTSVTLKKD